MSTSLVLVVLLGCLPSVLCSPKKKIFIGGLIPSYNADRYGYQAAIDIATETINNRSDILKDYEIIVKYGDTFGLPFYTVRRVFEFIEAGNQTIPMIVGPAWSKNTGISSLASRSWDIVQISYAASSVELHNNIDYPLLFTNVPATSSFNRARLSLIKRFGWKRIAILQEFDDKLYSSAVEDLRQQVVAENSSINFITIEGFSLFTESHPRIQLEKLQKLDARIILGEFSAHGAGRVFCEAYKMGMFGPKYVWLLFASLSSAWIFQPHTFKRYYKTVQCNVSLVTEAAEGFIVIDKIFLRHDNNRTMSGWTAEEFQQELTKRNYNARPYTSYAFDAMWTVALAMNKSLSEHPKYHPENFRYGDPYISRKYKQLLSQTKFEGLTGPHRFIYRERLGTVRISQMRLTNDKATLVQVGRHNTFENELFLFKDQINKLWKDGKVPADETRKEERILTYSLLQLIIVVVLATLGVLYSLGFLYFNISKRNQKVVRLSSPMINNVVLVGCLFCYIFVLLLGIDSRFVSDDALGTICNIRLYVLTIAFSLSFGALFSKTWRVHKIFTAHRAIKKKMMRDFHLIVFVFFLVIIDVVYITVWVYFDPLKTEDIIFEQKKEVSSDVIIIPILKICECTHRIKFLGALYAYKGILLLFGVFLAWETRNVTIPALNDSKYIGMSVYNVVILSAIGATISMVLKKTIYYELLHVLVSVVVLLSTTVTLTMVFLPKLHEYYFTKPEPEARIRTMETLSMSTHTSSTEMDDVYEAFVKRDVKHKWSQTEVDDKVADRKFPRPSEYPEENEENPRPLSNVAFNEDSGEPTCAVPNHGFLVGDEEPVRGVSSIWFHEDGENSTRAVCNDKLHEYNGHLARPVVKNGSLVDNGEPSGSVVYSGISMDNEDGLNQRKENSVG